MARRENLIDDLTGETIHYPVITVRSIRVEYNPYNYEWVGLDETHVFKNGKNLGDWVDREVGTLLNDDEERETY